MNTLRGFASILFAVVLLAVSASSQTSLTSLDGTRVDVQAQKGKVVVLAVGASWLPLSVKQAEFTNTIARRYAGKNVSVYYVFTDSTNAKSKNFASNDEIAKFAAVNKLGVTVLRDPDGAGLLKKFGIDQLPSFVILDGTGAQSGRPIGGIDPKFDITAPIGKVIDGLL